MHGEGILQCHGFHSISDTMGLIKLTCWSSLLATSVLAAPKRAINPPNVALDYATFKGRSDPTTQTWNYLGKLDVCLSSERQQLSELQVFPMPKLDDLSIRGCQLQS